MCLAKQPSFLMYISRYNILSARAWHLQRQKWKEDDVDLADYRREAQERVDASSSWGFTIVMLAWLLIIAGIFFFIYRSVSHGWAYEAKMKAARLGKSFPVD
jgi:hypothetical protein